MLKTGSQPDQARKRSRRESESVSTSSLFELEAFVTDPWIPIGILCSYGLWNS